MENLYSITTIFACMHLTMTHRVHRKFMTLGKVCTVASALQSMTGRTLGVPRAGQSRCSAASCAPTGDRTTDCAARPPPSHAPCHPRCAALPATLESLRSLWPPASPFPAILQCNSPNIIGPEALSSATDSTAQHGLACKLAPNSTFWQRCQKCSGVFCGGRHVQDKPLHA